MNARRCIGLKTLVWIFLLIGLSRQASEARSLQLKPGNSHATIRVGERNRSFRVHVPHEFSPGAKLPLVIVLHGAISSGRDSEWDSRMSKQSEKDHFIAVYPNGFFRTWNAGACCGPAGHEQIDDVAFIRELIAQCKKNLPIDDSRVYVAGVSNGGMLTYRLGIELADEIAAIAPVEGCMYPADVSNPIPVSVVIVHGTKDQVIPYNGGIAFRFGYKVNVPESVAETVKFWVERDHCNAQPSREVVAGRIRDVYGGGVDGTEVCVYTLEGGRHVWPGGRLCAFIGGSPVKGFSATESICQFFWTHPKRPSAAQ